MITCVIPYTGNREGLTALLVSLQPQLHRDDDIYIVDSSKDHSGLKIVALYATTRSFVFVEIAKEGVEIEDAVNAGFESMKQNKQKGALVISENVVISQTFIANLKKAIKNFGKEYGFFIPNIIKTPYPKMDSNFSWFNDITRIVMTVSPGQIVSTECYYMDERIVGGEKSFSRKVGVFNNEKVVVLPNSYNPAPNKS